VNEFKLGPHLGRPFSFAVFSNAPFASHTPVTIVIHHTEDAVICGCCFEYEYSNDATFAFACCVLAGGFDLDPGWADADLSKGG
jgi:hypothetical protein